MKKIIFMLLYLVVLTTTGYAQCPVSITAGGPTSFCMGNNVLLTATNGAGYTWQWKKNGTSINGATSQTYAALVSGSYTVQVTATGGCSAVSNTIVVTVTMDNVMITTHNGGTGISCLNGGETFHVTTGVGFTYQWKLNGNSINGATSTTYPTSAPGVYTCQVSNGTCTVITNGITASTQTANIITYDPTIFCTGSASLTAILNIGTGSPSIYQWKNGGVDIPGATSWTYGASTSGNYTCVISDLGFCNATTTSGNFVIQAGVPPQISVTTTTGAAWPVDLCNGQTVDLQINDLSNGQIWPGGVADWYKDGQSWQAFGGNMLLGVIQSGVYNAYITTSCGISFAQNGIPVRSLDPANPPVINNNGVTSNCSSVFLFVDPSTISFAPYQWKRNGIDIPGEIGPTMYATQTGNYSCQVSNSCTTMVTAPVAETITGPVAQITPQGPTTFCSGSSVVLDATAAGNTGYQWYLNSVSIAGATAATYVATTAGSYYVRATKTGCGFLNSSPVTVTVNANPAPVISASGATTFCSGGSVTLSVSNTAGATYKWRKNNVLINGATAFSYNATTTGNYICVKTNVAGCKGTSTAKTVTVNSLPNATATPQSATTFCAGDSVLIKGNYGVNYLYQWKKNNNNISAATSKNYTAKTAGTYKVKVTNASGCTKVSNSVSVTVPCREDENALQDENKPYILVYPNPSVDDFILTTDLGISENFSIHLFDMIGKEVFPDIQKISDTEFRISNLNVGIYFAGVKHQNAVTFIKIIKTL